jgi:hypothetical protein
MTPKNYDRYITGTNGIKIKSYICDPNLNRNKLSNKKIKLEMNFKHAAKKFHIQLTKIEDLAKSATGKEKLKFDFKCPAEIN